MTRPAPVEITYSKPAAKVPAAKVPAAKQPDGADYMRIFGRARGAVYFASGLTLDEATKEYGKELIAERGGGSKPAVGALPVALQRFAAGLKGQVSAKPKTGRPIAAMSKGTRKFAQSLKREVK
jgi:hypothetical protein